VPHALQATLYNGHEVVVQLLLDKSAEVNAQGEFYGNTAYAASYDGHEVVKCLMFICITYLYARAEVLVAHFMRLCREVRDGS
ncbi:hypothetical protein FB567DRAFT_443145, partial [Paraphoma chrysanthemicola]